jgi:cytochrome o ubiquinol oxidase subunit 1
VLVATAIFHTFNYDRSYHIHAEHIAEVEDQRTAQLAALPPRRSRRVSTPRPL